MYIKLEIKLKLIKIMKNYDERLIIFDKILLDNSEKKVIIKQNMQEFGRLELHVCHLVQLQIL